MWFMGMVMLVFSIGWCVKVIFVVVLCCVYILCCCVLFWVIIVFEILFVFICLVRIFFRMVFSLFECVVVSFISRLIGCGVLNGFCVLGFSVKWFLMKLWGMNLNVMIVLFEVF